jgi:flagellar biosynthesis GTPase FlhF
MKIKEFEAPTLKDCLNQVRSDLGPEAVILETQKVRRGGIMGWRARDAVKMTAAIGITVDEPPNQNRPAPRAAAQARSQAAPAQLIRQVEPGIPMTRASASTSVVDPIANQKIARLESELRELRVGMEAVRHSVSAAKPQAAVVSESAPAQFPKLYAALLGAEVPQELAKELLENLPDVRAWSP